ncbi:hypothetical protein NPX13_g3613 [Xylaria arbuscula]|uniref:Uncharacterized protein n=1 Tax=Xylaria arbuscula TaxID=114810 RepID=A0A9W8TMN5_9PEZI|nr:hypothetical protein NPX13_g3613 [Xylaria arbuscula]
MRHSAGIAVSSRLEELAATDPVAGRDDMGLQGSGSDPGQTQARIDPSRSATGSYSVMADPHTHRYCLATMLAPNK